MATKHDLANNELKLEKLINEMDARQLGRFLTLLVARGAVCFSDKFLEIADDKNVNYLNCFLVSLRIISSFYFGSYQDFRPHALNLTRVRARAPAFDRALALALAHNQTELFYLGLNDAEVILNRNTSTHDEAEYRAFQEKLFSFTSKLRALGGDYWADWYEKFFANKFVLDEIDIEAISSLKENQIQVPIAVTSAYLSAFVSENTDSNEIRLMVLGQKGEGKTSFARRFQKLDAEMPKPNESTEGIDMHDFLWEDIAKEFQSSEIDENYTKDIKIKIWDFAGHEVTHAAHKFFLSEKCVYVIVCQGRQGDSNIHSKIEYWLEHIKDYAGVNTKHKIFILINEWDANRPIVNESSIQANYQAYELVFKYLNIAKDNGKNGKLDDFRHSILEHIQTADTKIPAIFKHIQKRIDEEFKAERTNYVEKETIIDIIDEIKSNGDSNIKRIDSVEILKVLHSLAFCFWFDNIEGANTVVLNPRWITGAVYKIVNWVQKSEIYNNASIKIFDFHNVLRSNAKDAVIFPEDKDELIFNIMKCFELAYSEDGETLIIPHCLKDSYPDEEVGLSFEFENSVQMEIAIIAKGDSPLPEFPSSLIPRFIVKNFNSIHKNAKGNSVTSKNKAMFVSVDGKSLAEIKRNDRDNYRVYITVQGKNGNINFEDNIKFLCSLESCLGDILREHKRFQEQKPTISYRATKIDGKPVYLPANELRVKELPTIESYKGEKFKKEENARVIMFVNNHFGGDMHMGNTFNAGGNIAQTTTKAEKGAKVKVTVNQNNVSQENLVELTKEINEAKNQITFVPELEIKQKNSLMQLLDAVKIAVEKDDENAKEKCKSKFELFKEIADVALGNALLIIGSFSHLAKFFGG